MIHSYIRNYSFVETQPVLTVVSARLLRTRLVRIYIRQRNFLCHFFCDLCYLLRKVQITRMHEASIFTLFIISGVVLLSLALLGLTL